MNTNLFNNDDYLRIRDRKSLSNTHYDYFKSLYTRTMGELTAAFTIKIIETFQPKY
jgi:hypothetical protein